MKQGFNLRHFLFGKPIHARHAHHERLSVPFGLAVFASDALSSVAYATEEVLLVLILAGSMLAYGALPPISWTLVALLAIIAFSYYQTIQAYPEGGGTYRVSTENIGPFAGQFAGAALLIDYVLTVAVSVSSGVQAVISLAPGVQPYAVPIACTGVAVLGIMNLRGAKESGIVFAIPTYGFVILVLVLIGKSLFGAGTPPVTPDLPPWDGNPMHEFGLFLILRGFAASCTALTGTEAIADGVKAFQEPSSKNASKALLLMVTILGAMFIGISWAAWHSGVVPMESGEPGYRTVLAQLAMQQFGPGFFTTATLVMTAGILFLAANTAYADFPRLASFIARDGYLPRQLASIGDRLVFQNGIILLSLISMSLIVIFRADTHSLIPLYALGVFIAFTLSQTGMFRYFLRKRWLARKRFQLEGQEGEPLSARRPHALAARKATMQASISGFGAICCFIVGCILVYTKWEERIWIVVIAIGIMIVIFQIIRHYYAKLASILSVTPQDVLPGIKTTTLLLVPRLHKGILLPIQYARAMSPDARAIHVALSPELAEKAKEDWTRFGADMPLIVLDSPYRSIIDPVMDYIDHVLSMDKDRVVTVIVPEAVPVKWWQGLLHNNAAIPLKMALKQRRNVVITNIRYFMDQALEKDGAVKK